MNRTDAALAAMRMRSLTVLNALKTGTRATYTPTRGRRRRIGTPRRLSPAQRLLLAYMAANAVPTRTADGRTVMAFTETGNTEDDLYAATDGRATPGVRRGMYLADATALIDSGLIETVRILHTHPLLRTFALRLDAAQDHAAPARMGAKRTGPGEER